MKPKLMLAKQLPIEKISFPCLASIKYDGMQAITVEEDNYPLGKNLIKTNLISRNGKAIPNFFIRESLKALPPGLQGELILEGSNFTSNMSAIRSVEGKPDFRFIVFNWVEEGKEDLPYIERMEIAKNLVSRLSLKHIIFIKHLTIDSSKSLLDFLDKEIANGNEGLIVTYKDSPYIRGRSKYLVKIKNFVDEEFTILGFEPEVYGPTPFNIELGLVGQEKDKLGSIICKHSNGIFKAIPGFDDVYSQMLWEHKEKYLGKKVTVKYLSCGPDQLPRHPVAKIIRDYE